jgi:hypothetical protein
MGDYMVYRVYRNTGVKRIIEKGLTLNEAKRLVRSLHILPAW